MNTWIGSGQSQGQVIYTSFVMSQKDINYARIGTVYHKLI